MGWITRHARALQIGACVYMLLMAWLFSVRWTDSPAGAPQPVVPPATMHTEQFDPASAPAKPAAPEPTPERAPALTWGDAPWSTEKAEALQTKLVPFSTDGPEDVFAPYKHLAGLLGDWHVVTWSPVEGMSVDAYWVVVTQSGRGQLWVLHERPGLGSVEVVQRVDLPRGQVWTALTQEKRRQSRIVYLESTVLAWDAAGRVLRRVHLYDTAKAMEHWYDPVSEPLEGGSVPPKSPVHLHASHRWVELSAVGSDTAILFTRRFHHHQLGRPRVGTPLDPHR